MKVAGMIRLSEIDEVKVGKYYMKLSILSLSDMVSHLYFLKIGEISQEMMDFVNDLNIPIKIISTNINYGTGWNFKNNESLDDLYKAIDDDFDWVLYPDADDILPENTLELLQKADEIGAETVRFHFIECFGSENHIIEIKTNYPIGPHFKAVKHRKDITFVGSDGFNEAISINRPLIRYETEYCMRHLRYASIENISARKNMNYIQEYFLQNHGVIEYVPLMKFDYYKR